MSNRSRAYRRWVLRRAKERVRSVIKHVWYDGDRWCDDPEFIGRMTSVHLKPCSSPWCCGNPRRWRGKIDLTLVERKAALDDRDNLSVPWQNSSERQMEGWMDDEWDLSEW